MNYEKLTKADGKEYYLVPAKELDVKPITAKEEKQYDFVCQHSGERFMFGEQGFWVSASNLDLTPCAGRVYGSGSCSLAYFHTKESAIKWQEDKFGKRGKWYFFNKENYTVLNVDRKYTEDSLLSKPFYSEKECLEALHDYIWSNYMCSAEEWNIIDQKWKDSFSTNSGKEFYCNYIINQKREEL